MLLLETPADRRSLHSESMDKHTFRAVSKGGGGKEEGNGDLRGGMNRVPVRRGKITLPYSPESLSELDSAFLVATAAGFGVGGVLTAAALAAGERNIIHILHLHITLHPETPVSFTMVDQH